MDKPRNSASIVSVLLLGAVALGSYVSLYLCLLEPIWKGPSDGGYGRKAAYRHGGKFAVIVFVPAELVDRMIRPSYWTGEGLAHFHGE